jgi:diaminopimelate decarboxylase
MPLSCRRFSPKTPRLMNTQWIGREKAVEIAGLVGTPAYVYDVGTLRQQAEKALAFPAPHGLTVRYAMKAAPNQRLLQLFAEWGLEFDASSGYEVHRLKRAGIDSRKVSLSTQELPEDFAELVREGMTLNACSLHQLEAFGKAFPGQAVGLRFNPGLGSGGTNRTNVGGPASSFGIWHEQVNDVRAILERYGLRPFRIHTHIGSGSDPEVWKRVAALTLALAEAFPTVDCLNLGGGYKVARMPDETATDLGVIGKPVAQLLKDFAARTGRELHLEIEPGTFLVANACVLLAAVQDVAETGVTGYRFLKLNAGMTEILRPSLYGAQHPIAVLGADPSQTEPVIVVGHCCESGDILTPARGDPEALQPRQLPKAGIGDLVLIGGAGAYCASMSAKNYNSFPEAPEVLSHPDGSLQVIRKRQTLDQILANEC